MNLPDPNYIPTVLLVEDLEDDVLFFKHALKRAGIATHLHVSEDGLEAIDYLTNRGKFADRALYPRPDLMFLDLKMPNMNGFEVLEWLGQNTIIPPSRVAVLTGSAEPDDQARAQALGAAAYLVKPPAPEKLMEFFMSARTLAAKPVIPIEVRMSPTGAL